MQANKSTLEEARCWKCRYLMYKFSGKIDTEIICGKCRAINYPHRHEDPAYGLRGKDFQMGAVDLNCPLSHRLLVRVIGDGMVEIQSKYCKKRILFDTLMVRMGKKPQVLDEVTEEEKFSSQKIRTNLAK